MGDNDTIIINTEFVKDQKIEIGKVNVELESKSTSTNDFSTLFAPLVKTDLIVNSWKIISSALQLAHVSSRNTEEIVGNYATAMHEEDIKLGNDADKIENPVIVLATGGGNGSSGTNDFGGNSKELVDGILETASQEQREKINDELNKLAEENGVSVEELLTNGAYDDQVSALLVDLSNSDPSMNTLINGAMLGATGSIIESTISGYDEVTSNQSGEVISYIENIAEENEVSVEELLSNSEYKDIVDSSLNDLKDNNANTTPLVDTLLNSGDAQAALLGMMTVVGGVGSLSDSDSAEKVLSYLEQIAKENGITLEELLTNPKYKDLLNDALGKLKADNPLLSSFIDSVLGSSNPGAMLLGMMIAKDLAIKDYNTNAILDHLKQVAYENGITLEELLTNSKYAELLKEALLKLKKSNPELSSLIDTILDSNNPGMLLLGMLIATTSNSDSNSIDVIKEYLEQIAKENGITLEELLTDPKYKDLLKESLDKLKEKYPELSTLVDSILKYDDFSGILVGMLLLGDETKTIDEVNEILEYLRELAKENGITLEELLTDPKYKDLLRDALNKLKGEHPELSTLIDSILNSVNPGTILLGMLMAANINNNTNSVNVIRDYLEQIAKENGITLEELLTDPKYKDLLKESLDKLKEKYPELSTLIDSILKYDDFGGILVGMILALSSGDKKVIDKLNKILEYLKQIANENGITLEELLTDPAYKDLLLDALNKLKDESPELGSLIDSVLKYDVPGLVLYGLLLKIINTIGLKDKLLLKEYLEQIAKENGITLEELLTDPKYKNLLMESLNRFKEKYPELADWTDLLLKFDDFSKILYGLLFNNTNNILGEDILILKQYLEEYVKNFGITIGDLLTDAKNKDLLNEALKKLEEDKPNLKGLISLLLGLGTTSALLAMINYNINTGDIPKTSLFMHYIEKLAKENNISVKDLLNSIEYCDLLAEGLREYKGLLKIILEISKNDKDMAYQLVNQILSSKYPEVLGVPEITVNIRKLLDIVSSEVNVSVEMLPNKPELLFDILVRFEDSVSVFEKMTKENEGRLQTMLSQLYNREVNMTVDNTVIAMLLEYLRDIATNNNVTIEVLLNDPFNSEMVLNSIINFIKIVLFIAILGNLKEQDTFHIINKIYKLDENSDDHEEVIV